MKGCDECPILCWSLTQYSQMTEYQLHYQGDRKVYYPYWCFQFPATVPKNDKNGNVLTAGFT